MKGVSRMDDEKKYEVKGVVTIGTDEYRDLIEERMSAKYELDEYRSKYWNEQNKVSNLEKKLKKLESDYDKVSEFVRLDNERYQSYVHFVAEKSVEAE